MASFRVTGDARPALFHTTRKLGANRAVPDAARGTPPAPCPIALRDPKGRTGPSFDQSQLPPDEPESVGVAELELLELHEELGLGLVSTVAPGSALDRS